MNSRYFTVTALLSAAMVFAIPARGQVPVGTAFTYQGKLDLSGSPVSGTVDFRFNLWDAATAGNLIASAPQVNGVSVTDGLFDLEVDFGAGAFDGNARWIEIGIANPSGGEFTYLSPRQPLNVAPYAETARTSLSGWNLGGNSGTTAGTNFLGTVDNQPFELRVRNIRQLRLELPDNAFGLLSGGNVLWGYQNNAAGTGVRGAVIGGGGSEGGSPAFANIVESHFGTIGGGRGNRAGSVGPTAAPYATVGGGNGNGATAFNTTVAGGVNNQASANNAAVGGGANNVSGGTDATVAGGFINSASGIRSSIGGGDTNSASGDYSTIPGGRLNIASGNYSFAAGGSAHAVHSGAFVWSDPPRLGDTTFASTANDQFIIRARGGVGIGTASPSNALSVVGSANITGNMGIGVSTPTNKLSVAGVADFSGNVGIGTSTPSNALEVVGNGSFTGNLGLGVTSPGNRLSVDGDADIAGSLGIGTNSPTVPLDVRGAGNVRGNLGVKRSDGTPLLNLISTGNGAGQIDVFGRNGLRHTKIGEVDANRGGIVFYDSATQQSIASFFTSSTNEAYITSQSLTIQGSVFMQQGLTVSTLALVAPPQVSGLLDIGWNSSNNRIERKSSSRRYKDNIKPFVDDFDKILRLDLKQWTPKGNDSGPIGFGFIAEEVEDIGLKNLVLYNEKGQVESLLFGNIQYYLLEVIKRHDREVKALELTNAELNDSNEQLRAELSARDADVADLQDRVARLEALVQKLAD